MSARAKTSDTQICQAVRRLLESGGEENLSMQAIADAVGIRAPSLYKRFSSRADLLSTAARDALRELAESLQEAVEINKPSESLERMAHLYRKFAKKSPRTYTLIFAESLAPRDDLLAARQAVAEPLLSLLTPALGKETASYAARLLVSYLHGFLSMELTKTFRLGGNGNDAFQYGLRKTVSCLLTDKVKSARTTWIQTRVFAKSKTP
jgi:AcrR family transcriptional regulator